MEIALDIAFQCSPDHPWVKEHPAWFNIRPDGSIQYAENPPKKYQDIYPLNFESPEWRALWDELLRSSSSGSSAASRSSASTIPHTKALPFWEWCIAKVRAEIPRRHVPGRGLHPAARHVFAGQGRLHAVLHLLHLAQRPRPSCRRTSKRSRSRRSAISSSPTSGRTRPTSCTRSLQEGGRPAFMQRLILAATLTANYGIYGPAYELARKCPGQALPGKTESKSISTARSTRFASATAMRRTRWCR